MTNDVTNDENNSETKSEFLKLFHNLYKLKTTARAGWVRCGITEPESVAEHTFRTAFIAMVLGDHLNLNTAKMLKMSLLHDLAEVVTGDITPFDYESVEEKRNKENTAMNDLLSGLPQHEEYIKLWDEYDRQLTFEAKVVRNIDKFEMAIQALEYQKEYPDLNLQEFIIDAKRHIDIPEIDELFKIVNADMDNISRKD